jgi:SH3 domain
MSALTKAGDLNFTKGEVITILERTDGEEWWSGRIGSREGIVRVSYFTYAGAQSLIF